MKRTDYFGAVTADELKARYDMEGHVEDGLYLETHYEAEEGKRPASGSIYYYVPADTKTMFHSIDCDEYWIYNAGEDLQIWIIDEQGKISVQRLGIGEGAEPKVYLKKGWIFASRHDGGAQDGTFVVCVTVPRFKAEMLRLYPKEEIVQAFPAAENFWQD